MSKKIKKRLLPELRFTEFGDEKDWKSCSLGSICEVLNNRRKPVTSNNREKGAYPYYGASGIVDYVKEYIFDERLLLVGEDGAKWGAYEKTAFIVEGRYWVNNHAHVLKPKKINDSLLENYLIKLDLSPFITGAAPPKLTLQSLKSIPVPVPLDTAEQKKIADCLSSLDELISTHTQKHEALQSYKKGLMQNLFPAEGETVPALRFPEFENTEEWELKPFSKYVKLYRGSSPRPIREYLTKNGNGVNWIKIGDVNLEDGFFIKAVSEKITTEGAKKSRKVNKGELVLANSMSYGKVYQLGLGGCIYDGWFVLREYERAFDKQFLLQLLNSSYIQNQYSKLAAGGIVQNISSDIVYTTILPKPSIKEQQKIADCLSSLDKLVAAQAHKIEELNDHKKGLMQQLFPTVDEVNA